MLRPGRDLLLGEPGRLLRGEHLLLRDVAGRLLSGWAGMLFERLLPPEPEVLRYGLLLLLRSVDRRLLHGQLLRGRHVL